MPDTEGGQSPARLTRSQVAEELTAQIAKTVSSLEAELADITAALEKLKCAFTPPAAVPAKRKYVRKQKEVAG